MILIDQKALRTQLIAARIQNILDQTNLRNFTLFFSLVKELQNKLLYLSANNISSQQRHQQEEEIKKIGCQIKDIGGFDLLLIIRDYFLDDFAYEAKVTELWKYLGNW